jgi:Secretion system C-terminal sorting domain
LHGWSLAAIRTQVGGILRTVDGGNSWACHVTPELFYAISFIDTSNGFVTKGNSPIFAYRTVDGGRTWHVLGQIFDPLWGDPIINALSFTDSLYGWAFGIMFYQGDLAGVVFHTTDGGMSWYLEHVGQTRRMNDGFMLDRFHGWAVGDQGAVFAYAPVSSVGQKLPDLPRDFSLKQNYPNPFNPSTRIEYEVQRRALVRIAVYDIIGRKVAQLVDGEHEPGVYQVYFEAGGLASGVYVYTMTSGTFSESKQMVIIK